MSSLRMTSRLFSSTTTKLYRNNSSLRLTLHSSWFDSRSLHSLIKPSLARPFSSIRSQHQVTVNACLIHTSIFNSRSLHSLTKSNLMRLLTKSNLLSYEKPLSQVITKAYSHEAETDDDFDCRFETYFSKPDIDGWEVRQGINELIAYDCVPEPRIICAVLKACRRVSDYSLAIRFLEAVKFKCGGQLNVIYPYILQEIRPTLCELGVDTPEELGFDKPELWLESIDDIH